MAHGHLEIMMIGAEWIFPILKTNGVNKKNLIINYKFSYKKYFFYTHPTLISKGIVLRKRSILTEQNGETSVVYHSVYLLSRLT